MEKEDRGKKKFNEVVGNIKKVHNILDRVGLDIGLLKKRMNQAGGPHPSEVNHQRRKSIGQPFHPKYDSDGKQRHVVQEDRAPPSDGALASSTKELHRRLSGSLGRSFSRELAAGETCSSSVELGLSRSIPLRKKYARIKEVWSDSNLEEQRAISAPGQRWNIPPKQRRSLASPFSTPINFSTRNVHKSSSSMSTPTTDLGVLTKSKNQRQRQKLLNRYLEQKSTMKQPPMTKSVSSVAKQPFASSRTMSSLKPPTKHGQYSPQKTMANTFALNHDRKSNNSPTNVVSTESSPASQFQKLAQSSDSVGKAKQSNTKSDSAEKLLPHVEINRLNWSHPPLHLRKTESNFNSLCDHSFDGDQGQNTPSLQALEHDNASDNTTIASCPPSKNHSEKAAFSANEQPITPTIKQHTSKIPPLRQYSKDVDASKKVLQKQEKLFLQTLLSLVSPGSSKELASSPPKELRESSNNNDTTLKEKLPVCSRAMASSSLEGGELPLLQSSRNENEMLASPSSVMVETSAHVKAPGKIRSRKARLARKLLSEELNRYNEHLASAVSNNQATSSWASITFDEKLNTALAAGKQEDFERSKEVSSRLVGDQGRTDLNKHPINKCRAISTENIISEHDVILAEQRTSSEQSCLFETGEQGEFTHLVAVEPLKEFEESARPLPDRCEEKMCYGMTSWNWLHRNDSFESIKSDTESDYAVCCCRDPTVKLRSGSDPSNDIGKQLSPLNGAKDPTEYVALAVPAYDFKEANEASLRFTSKSVENDVVSAVAVQSTIEERGCNNSQPELTAFAFTEKREDDSFPIDPSSVYSSTPVRKNYDCNQKCIYETPMRTKKQTVEDNSLTTDIRNLSPSMRRLIEKFESNARSPATDMEMIATDDVGTLSAPSLTSCSISAQTVNGATELHATKRKLDIGGKLSKVAMDLNTAMSKGRSSITGKSISNDNSFCVDNVGKFIHHIPQSPPKNRKLTLPSGISAIFTTPPHRQKNQITESPGTRNNEVSVEEMTLWQSLHRSASIASVASASEDDCESIDFDEQHSEREGDTEPIICTDEQFADEPNRSDSSYSDVNYTGMLTGSEVINDKSLLSQESIEILPRYLANTVEQDLIQQPTVANTTAMNPASYEFAFAETPCESATDTLRETESALSSDNETFFESQNEEIEITPLSKHFVYPSSTELLERKQSTTNNKQFTDIHDKTPESINCSSQPLKDYRHLVKDEPTESNSQPHTDYCHLVKEEPTESNSQPYKDYCHRVKEEPNNFPLITKYLIDKLDVRKRYNLKLPSTRVVKAWISRFMHGETKAISDCVPNQIRFESYNVLREEDNHSPAFQPQAKSLLCISSTASQTDRIDDYLSNSEVESVSEILPYSPKIEYRDQMTCTSDFGPLLHSVVNRMEVQQLKSFQTPRDYVLRNARTFCGNVLYNLAVMGASLFLIWLCLSENDITDIFRGGEFYLNNVVSFRRQPGSNSVS